MTGLISLAAIRCGARTELSEGHQQVMADVAAHDAVEDTTGRVVPIRIMGHVEAHFAVMSDGSLRMWGASAIPSLRHPLRPTVVPGVRSVVALCGSEDEIEYLTETGEVFRITEAGSPPPGDRRADFPPLRDLAHTWGTANGGWLTVDGVAIVRSFVNGGRVTSTVPFRALGAAHGIGEDGNVYAWSAPDNLTARRVDAPFRAVNIWEHCILSDQGEVACTGHNFGSNGLPADGQFVREFVRIPGVRDVVALSPFHHLFVMLHRDGTLSRAGMVGPGDCLAPPDAIPREPNPPRVVPGIRHVRGLSATSSSLCLLFADHSVSCCGVALGGSLGDGRTTESAELVRVAF